jgi:guanylate kinase
VVERLLELDPDLWLSRSWTTRPRRPGEPEDAYTFVDRGTFLDRLSRGGFVEYTEFPGTGHLYGTPTFEGPDGKDPNGKDIVLEIELDGARQVKERFPDAKLIMIVAPSREAREARLRARGDSEEHIERRLTVGEEEERIGRNLADAVVVNDDVERAAREVAGILNQFRLDPPGVSS